MIPLKWMNSKLNLVAIGNLPPQSPPVSSLDWEVDFCFVPIKLFSFSGLHLNVCGTYISKIHRYFLSLQRAPEELEYCGALAEHQGLQEQPADQQCLQRHLVEHCFLQSPQEGSGTALISRRASDSVMITGSQCSRVLQSSLESSGELT